MARYRLAVRPGNRENRVHIEPREGASARSSAYRLHTNTGADQREHRRERSHNRGAATDGDFQGAWDPLPGAFCNRRAIALFDDGQKDEVLEAMLHFVRIVGKRKNASTGRISSIKIHDIERLEDREDSRRTVATGNSDHALAFGNSNPRRTVQAQNVQPICRCAGAFRHMARMSTTDLRPRLTGGICHRVG